MNLFVSWMSPATSRAAIDTQDITYPILSYYREHIWKAGSLPSPFISLCVLQLSSPLLGSYTLPCPNHSHHLLPLTPVTPIPPKSWNYPKLFLLKWPVFHDSSPTSVNVQVPSLSHSPPPQMTIINWKHLRGLLISL